MQPFTMSHHALTRAVDMAVEGDEIRAAFERPLEKFFSPRTQTWWLTRGRITLCIADEVPLPVVATILWARTSDWVADEQFAPLDGRGDTDLSGSRRLAHARKRRR